MKSNRLYFIDAVRAFAIIMMLQGHFIDTLLAEEYHNSTHIVYQIWKYFRGITAPTFFTISGLIFTYLLMRSKKKGNSLQRIKKGLYRGFTLILIGYALRAPIFHWFTGVFPMRFLNVDVLQIIGISLIAIVGVYYVTFKKSLVFAIIMFFIGVSIFIMEPWYRALQIDHLPVFLSNYLTKSNGSIFTILPWFGYMAIGSFIASIFYRFLDKERFKPALIMSMSVLGMILIYHSSLLLMNMYWWTDILLFKQVAYYNYLFTRLGNVLILLSVFYALEQFLQKSLILKIGQKTLSIYVIHFIIIYGSLTGFGLHQIIGKTLSPTLAILGAISFITIVVIIALYGVKTNAIVYQKLRTFMSENKK